MTVHQPGRDALCSPVEANGTGNDACRSKQIKEHRQMAGETPREEAPVYAAPAPQLGAAARKYVTEFIGTFFLTFAVAVAALTGSMFVPLAAGGILMVMIYAGGHISGAHYNPAVTLAALVRRRIGIGDAAAYWIAQVVGGVVAGVLARAVVNPRA